MKRKIDLGDVCSLAGWTLAQGVGVAGIIIGGMEKNTKLAIKGLVLTAFASAIKISEQYSINGYDIEV